VRCEQSQQHRQLPTRRERVRKLSALADYLGGSGHQVSVITDTRRLSARHLGLSLVAGLRRHPHRAKHEYSLTLDGKSAAPDVARALETSELYRLDAPQVQSILAEVRAGLSEWRQMARARGIPNLELSVPL